MLDIRKKMNEAARHIKKVSKDFQPDAGLILGSGLGVLAEEIEEPIEIPYTDIPNMKTSTVKGHAGKLVMGILEGKKVMAFKGRIHYYEGYSMKDITFPVRIMQALGARFLVITNACGGLREDMVPGDLMVISDHINLMGDNPLYGLNDDQLGPRFPDMSNVYDMELQQIALKIMGELNLKLLSGVYCAVPGPNYETYAEVEYIRRIGSDVVGMSTVPEVLVAAHAGIRVVGISCITDVINTPGIQVTHEEVLKVATEAKPRFLKLMRKIISQLPVEEKTGGKIEVSR